MDENLASKTLDEIRGLHAEIDRLQSENAKLREECERNAKIASARYYELRRQWPFESIEQPR